MTAGRRAVAALAVAAALALPAITHAGRACETQPLTVTEIERGLGLAQRTAAALDASGAEVVLLARAGQDLGRYGLRWSHLGFVYRDRDAQGRLVWRVLHKLNHCGSDQSALYRQGLGEFFLDRPHRYEAAFAVPTPALQAALRPLLQDNDRAAALHERRYSMVAYPFATRYQQSNQWVLETLARAADPAVASRRQAQAWLQLKDYQPTVLRLGPLTRLGARVGSGHIAFDDHPDGERFADRIATVTADSMFDWLARSGLAGAAQTLR